MPSSPSPRSDAALNLARLCAAAALDKKAEDLSLLCLTDLCAYTDYCLLISASSARQVGAVADNVRSVLKKTGIKPLSVSGLREGQWALLDFGEVVVHIFYRPVREYYDLESLWADARRETLDEAELAALLAEGAGFSKIPPSKRGESGTKWRLKRR